MPANLSGGKQQPHAEAVDADIVADGSEVFHTLTNQGPNQIFGDAAQTEAADHDDSTVEHVANSFIGTGNDFVHKKRF
jgi:hypothetical protein